jgi:hypothetical protein
MNMAHISIETLLNSIARTNNRRLTHAELARALNVSEQVITNWASRGISAEGALTAQLVFQKDANFILGRLPHPMLLPRQEPPAQPVLQVREEFVTYLPTPKVGTLTEELLDLFGKLDDDGKREWLADLRGFVRGRRPHEVGNAPKLAGQ